MSAQLNRRHFLRNVSAGAAGWGLATGFPPDASAAPSPWKAGLAQVNITPQKSLWMAGYAARTKPSEGIALDIHAKALALQDSAGHRAVMVTTDLLGFPATVSHNMAERVEKKYHLTRNQLLLSSSHTHAGPVIGKMLELIYPMSAQQWADVGAYTSELEDKVVHLVGAALKSLRPARLSLGHGEAGFAMNRRARTNGGMIIGVNKEGPVDHDVPVLRVDDLQGTLRGVVFGYACHNTTAHDVPQVPWRLRGICPGRAAKTTTRAPRPCLLRAVVVTQNPYPRGTLELARQHGEELAASVEKVLAQGLPPVRGPLKTAYEEFPVAFAHAAEPRGDSGPTSE